MRVPTKVIEANLATAESIAHLLRSRPEPAVRIPGATWSVGEAAAHLALANQLMAAVAGGERRPYGDGTPGGLAAANEESLADYPERDPVVLADAIVAHTRAFAAAIEQRDATETVLTPMGPMDLGTLPSYLLTHQLGHGYDLARALRHPHMIDRERVELSLPFLLTAMPRVVDRRTAADRHARYTVGLRGGPRFGVALADGEVTISQPPAPGADCVIVTEPVTFLLLALGRCNPAGAIARGRILAWGRKPWLAPAFPTYFKAP
ncbi:maleylpyruvate isomerase family mycothiol-dependent enzyme [Kitasatospora sp. NBC_01266]|uniref:maleylpyruvate isomerase family mycothiol-dependent enzyme n=1 Tax=Kitasatospora sp. NBC_01266 TaxID=2903572 RepID=UPI002E37E24D|nr:maleylpyruvate isomerase family mycothiol-dependent enzyme [Kitasatospora sp. NBC_01266]